MSDFMQRPSSKRFLSVNQQNQQNSSSIKKNKKKSNSQSKHFQAPDIITQVNPTYLNNFIKPINPHQSAFTPTNHSNKLNEEMFLLPKKSSEFINKKTLILDLDETLVHSSFTSFEKNDIVLNVDFDGMMYNIYVLVRPGAENFIKNVSKFFEIVIFTASLSNYASPLLDILDSENNIKYRLYRDHCTFINGIYIKDLKKLNRNLKDLIIVDNSPLAYAFDTDNGLPIKTWYEDPNDIELIKITKILEFLSKTKDVRKYIKKFVKENEIMYEDAIMIIKNIENKIKNINNNINNINYLNNSNSFVNKANSTNNLNNTNTNNENSYSNFNHTTNIKTINIINNLKDNITLNKTPNNILEYSSSGENSKNHDSKRNIIKYKSHHENKNANKEIDYIKSNDFYSNNNKMSKSNMNHNNIKKNIISLQDIAIINNIIKRQQADSFENGKINHKFLLANNAKQKHKNNNIFRFSQKNDLKNNSNININNNLYVNKYNSLMPMTLSTSNTARNIFLNNKPFFQINNINLINNINYGIIPNINVDNKEKLKNNYINIIQDKKQGNNKNKYTNLLNQYGPVGIKSYYQSMLEKNSKLLGFGNLKKSKHLRISSSIGSHRGFAPFNNSNKDYDQNYTFHVQRSKSTGHFFKLGKQGKLSPKTPNRHIVLQKNGGEIEKQQKFFNIYSGISFSNTARNNNMQNIGKNNGDYKYKRSQSSKKIY